MWKQSDAAKGPLHRPNHRYRTVCNAPRHSPKIHPVEALIVHNTWYFIRCLNIVLLYNYRTLLPSKYVGRHIPALSSIVTKLYNILFRCRCPTPRYHAKRQYATKKRQRKILKSHYSKNDCVRKFVKDYLNCEP